MRNAGRETLKAVVVEAHPTHLATSSSKNKINSSLSSNGSTSKTCHNIWSHLALWLVWSFCFLLLELSGIAAVTRRKTNSKIQVSFQSVSYYTEGGKRHCIQLLSIPLLWVVVLLTMAFGINGDNSKLFSAILDNSKYRVPLIWSNTMQKWLMVQIFISQLFSVQCEDNYNSTV